MEATYSASHYPRPGCSIHVGLVNQLYKDARLISQHLLTNDTIGAAPHALPSEVLFMTYRTITTITSTAVLGVVVLIAPQELLAQPTSVAGETNLLAFMLKTGLNEHKTTLAIAGAVTLDLQYIGVHKVIEHYA